jgi:ubiquinone/menaquinone biosynthesis C-methylase UbiE
VYALGQFVGRPTTNRFRRLLRENVPPGRRVLDLGCGIGNYRDEFTGTYTGLDLNPDYIAAARKRYENDRLDVADATALQFPADSFDDVVSIAITHHLDDKQLVAMVRGALASLSPDGALHVIDAVLPYSPNVAFKRWWFGLDQGKHPRPPERLEEVVARAGSVRHRQRLPGPLHDTLYLQVVGNS